MPLWALVLLDFAVLGGLALASYLLERRGRNS